MDKGVEPNKGFLARYRHIGFPILLAAFVVLGLLMLVPFYPAILWASILTVLLTPLHRRFQKKWSPNTAALMTTLATLAIVGLPLLLIGAAFFFQVNEFAQTLKSSAPAGQEGLSMDSVVQELETALKPLIQSVSPEFKLTEWFNEHKDQLMQSVTAPAGKIAFSIGYTLFTLVVAFLTMFFMLRDGQKLREPALEVLPLPRESGERILSRLSDTIRAVFVGIVLVAIIQGTVAGITYYFVGIPQALLWGVATIVLCTIPLVGSPIVYIPMSLILFSQGKTVEALVLLGVGFLIISQIDNVIRPFIIGAKVELHPMAVFFSLLGGVFLFGPVGIMAGPMALAVLLVLVDVLRERLRDGTELPKDGATEAAPP